MLIAYKNLRIKICLNVNTILKFLVKVYKKQFLFGFFFFCISGTGCMVLKIQKKNQPPPPQKKKKRYKAQHIYVSEKVKLTRNFFQHRIVNSSKNCTKRIEVNVSGNQ